MRLSSHGYGTTLVVGARLRLGRGRRDGHRPDVRGAVDIVGAHYPCTYVSQMTSCSTTQNALNTGKQLWASENGSEDYNAGGAPMARAINRGYIDAQDVRRSSTGRWSPSIYPNLPFATTALMVANQPWSGCVRRRQAAVGDRAHHPGHPAGLAVHRLGLRVLRRRPQQRLATSATSRPTTAPTAWSPRRWTPPPRGPSPSRSPAACRRPPRCTSGPATSAPTT